MAEIDIGQVTGLEGILAGLRADLDLAYNSANNPVRIEDVVGLQEELNVLTPVLARGAFAGLIVSNTPGFAFTQVTVSPGMCRDAANSADLVLPAGISKSITQVWAPGSGVGGHDGTSFLPDEWFHVFLIMNPSTMVVDVLFSHSANAPALPVGYTKYRRIRGLLIDAQGGVWQFRQKPGSFIQKIPRSVEATNLTGLTALGTMRQLHVPRGIKTQVMAVLTSNSNSAGGWWSGLYDPDDGPAPEYGVPTQWGHIRRDTTTPFLTEVTGLVWTDVNGMVLHAGNDPDDVSSIGSIGYWDYAESWSV
jgi:hypothetical protein